MSNRGARRSAPPKGSIERQARAEAARAQRLAARVSSNSESVSASQRALTIREKIIRWLEEKL